MAAPVVPTRLAIAAPKARMPALVHGVPRKVAGDENAAGDDIEREQQHDEAEIFGEHGVHEGGHRRRRAEQAASGSSVSTAQPQAILP